MLIDWINDVLVGERIIVKDLAEDLYDGQVLQKLFGKKLSLNKMSHRYRIKWTRLSGISELLSRTKSRLPQLLQR